MHFVTRTTEAAEPAPSMPAVDVRRRRLNAPTPARVTVADLPLDLITDAAPDDPLLDIALTHALLRDVAAGRRPDALRIFRPGPTLAFGRLDALLPGFGEASAAARRRGYTPVVRSAGGHAAVYDRDCLVVEHVTHEEDVTARLQDRFDEQSALLRDALAELGADARVGELPGEYCAGAHSIHLGGRIKVVGIAQRAVRHGALTTAVVVVGGGEGLRYVIAEVYGALGLAVDPARAGALDDELPGVGVDRVERAIRDAYARAAPLTPTEPDEELRAAARALAPRHEVR
jgi:octanoyl-[GcvH]:protein N-octanoyltransferase